MLLPALALVSTIIVDFRAEPKKICSNRVTEITELLEGETERGMDGQTVRYADGWMDNQTDRRSV